MQKKIFFQCISDLKFEIQRAPEKNGFWQLSHDLPVQFQMFFFILKRTTSTTKYYKGHQNSITGSQDNAK
jgi:hypothetical protein